MEYGHGGDVYSRPVTWDYSANISPLGVPEGVKRAAAESLENCDRYPDPECRLLRERLAVHHGLSGERILCGNGAADLIFQLAWAMRNRCETEGRMRAADGETASALVLAPTFSEYEQAFGSAGFRIRRHLLRRERGFALEPAAWIRDLDDSVRTAFLCNPNNPTGFPILREDVLQMAAACRERGILLVVDECFCEFLEEPERCSVISDLNRFPNVFVLKAFTKLYAMAGLRLGYGLCEDAELIGLMGRVRQPWSVSAPAQAAGIAALKETEYVSRVRELIRKERPRLKADLERMGFQVYDSGANYLFFRDPADCGGTLAQRCLARGLLIRSCANYHGLDSSFYRICVKTEEENRQMCRILEAVRRRKT